jgi:hypothetical protein
MQRKVQFFRHASQMYLKFQKGRTSVNENHGVRKVTCYCHAVYSRKLQQITPIRDIKQNFFAKM